MDLGKGITTIGGGNSPPFYKGVNMTIEVDADSVKGTYTNVEYFEYVRTNEKRFLLTIAMGGRLNTVQHSVESDLVVEVVG